MKINAKKKLSKMWRKIDSYSFALQFVSQFTIVFYLNRDSINLTSLTFFGRKFQKEVSTVQIHFLSRLIEKVKLGSFSKIPTRVPPFFVRSFQLFREEAALSAETPRNVTELQALIPTANWKRLRQLIKRNGRNYF